MPMQYFGDAFPELAQAECRVLHVLDGDEHLPADGYVLVEMYCNERDCDCRRVSFNVISEATEEQVCIISFGFDRKDSLAGPFIDPLYPRKAFAGELLEMIDQLVLSDPKYLARLRRHYRMFKDEICGQPLARRLSPSGLTLEQVSERIAERKKRHKALRRAQQRHRRSR